MKVSEKIEVSNTPWGRSSWARMLAVLGLYAVLSVVITWPIAGRLGTHIPASGGDAWIHVWTFNWIKEAIQQGVSPYFTRYLFFPDGVSLLFHNIAWVNIAIWLPLQAIIGPDTAYSLLFLGIFTFNGFATYLLTREVSGSEPGAFIAGLVVAFWPYTLSHHNHPNLIFIGWVPLALLALKRYFDHRQLRYALMAGIFIALLGLTRWQLLIMGGILIGAYVLYRLVLDKRLWTVRVARDLVITGILSLLIMAPLLSPVVLAQVNRENPDELFVDEELGQTDLLAYLVPSRYHPIWGKAAFELTENFTVNKVFVPFIGFTVLLLTGVGIATQWPKARFWLLIALIYILLALGPELQINGRLINLPMPYDLIDDLFLTKLIRRPDRLNVILSIPIAVLTALGTSSLLQRVRSRSTVYGLAGVLAFLILAEYVVDYPTFPLTTPAWYEDLARETGDFGILGIPMNPRALPDKAYMFYQRTHGKPIVEGHVSRPPEEAFRFIDQVPLLQSQRPVDIVTPDPALGNISTQLRLLAEANIRYLIIHKEFLREEEVEAWREWMVIDPLHEDRDLIVYRTEPVLGRDFNMNLVVTSEPNGEPDLGLVRASVSPTSVSQAESLQVKTVWASRVDLEENYGICLHLVSSDGAMVQKACQPISDSYPTDKWRENEIVTEQYTIESSPYLTSDTYTISFTLVNRDTQRPTGEDVVIGDFQLTAIPKVFGKPDPEETLALNWDDKIYLHGYDIEYPDDRTLALTVYWQALVRMDESYTTFVHLVESDTGDIVSQADVIPRGWSYPTNWWEEDELVEDRVTIDLSGIQNGEYDLYVGWYQAESGQRLPVWEESGQGFPDNSALLDMIRR